MKKIYFLLLALGLFTNGNAQNPSDRDPNFNQLNLPLNNYFVDHFVTKSTVLPDGKILLIQHNMKLVKLNGNLLDSGFIIGSSTSQADLLDFAVQPDGKIIVGGEFFSYNGMNLKKLIRLNPDGTVDSGFNAQTISFYGPTSIEVQPDGKILVIDQEAILRRLNANGSIDPSFATATYCHFGKMALQSDGKIMVSHNTNNNSEPIVDKLSRLNANGSFDPTFTTVAFTNSINNADPIEKIKIQSDGKVLIAGTFVTNMGRNLVRLNNNGTEDLSFSIGSGFTVNPGSFNSSTTRDIIVLSDHKIIVVGLFDKYNNIRRKNIVRLNQDGSIDTTLGETADFLGIEAINSASLFNDGKILVSGTLGGEKVNSHILKLNSDGSRDLNFNNRGKGFFTANVLNVVETPDGKIYAGGSFHAYNNVRAPHFIRLNSDGTIDNTLTLGGGNGFEDGYVNIIKPLSNGQVFLAGTFTRYNGVNTNNVIRINSDGVRDNVFNIPGTGFNNYVNAIHPLSNGSLLVGGIFTNFNQNNCSGLVRLSATGANSMDFSIGNDVRCIKEQADSKILVGGRLRFSGSPVPGIRRYSSTMILDTNFILDPVITASIVDAISLQQDGKILIKGDFTVNGVSKKLIRIFSDGGLDNSFNFMLSNGESIGDFAVLLNQKIIICLSTTVSQGRIIRLNNNGSVDSVFTEQLVVDNSFSDFHAVPYLYPLANDKILLSGLLNYQGQSAGGLIRLMGEDYNFMQGQNKIDSNTNGCDINDLFFTNLKLQVSSVANSFDYITNSTGNYKAALANGTHTIAPVFENPTYFNASPSTVNVTFPTQASPFTQNFCITANGVHPDLEVTVLPIQSARPGFDAIYKVVYKNKGNTTQSGTVNFVFNDAVLDLISSSPVVSTQTVNNLSWNFSNLLPFETREITLTLNVNSPMETPAVNNGDILSYTATVASVAIDDLPNDNTFAFNQTVVNSFDPNDKTCLEGNTITPDKVGEYVHYMIRFENTGTFPAQNIIVKDMIDATKFDVSSLVSIKGSHSFVTNITAGNKVEFIFENINLPFDDANNDGYVAFKIKTKPTLVDGDTFSNTASIYFDYNFPIVTNAATTTIAALAVEDFEFSNYFKVYPNPVHDVLNISSKGNIEVSSINIYNTLGQLVLVIPNAKDSKTVDVSSLAEGNYFIKINSDKGTSNTKFIKN